MPEKFIVRKRGIPLVVIEIILASIFVTRWLHLKYEFDWILMVIVFFITSATISVLFFRVRLFRYILSIGFSLCWAFIGYALLEGMTKSTTSPWIAGIFIFVVALFLHKSYFDLEREAHRIDY